MNLSLNSASNDAVSSSRLSRGLVVTPRLLNAREAASYLGVSPYLLNTIPVMPVLLGSGGRPAKRWDRRSLDRWLDEIAGLTPQTAADPDTDLESEMAEWSARHGH